MTTPSRFSILHYLTRHGDDVYEQWLERLDRQDADRVDAYVSRMERGNFGVTRSVGEGVLELKIHVGPGYRVYYLRHGARVVVLLFGGDKSTQVKDIAQAKAYSADYWRRQ